MALPLDDTVRIVITSRLATPEEIRETVALAEDLGPDSLWCGEHIAYTSPVLDPFVRLSYAAAMSERLTLGTCVYLVPLRPAAAVAKQVVSIDHLSGGRFVFGAGVGGELPGEFDACGVAVNERGGTAEASDCRRLIRSPRRSSSPGPSPAPGGREAARSAGVRSAGTHRCHARREARCRRRLGARARAR